MTLALPAALYAQTVVRAPGANESLASRWQWALQQTQRLNCGSGCWIGYSITRRMDRRSYIGSWDSDAEDQKSLGEIIYGKRIIPAPTTADGKVVKQVALLFRLAPGTRRIEAVDVSNLSRPVDLQAPLLWLGPSADAPSIALISKLYKDAQNSDVEKHLVMAIALHHAPKLTMPFLGRVLKGQAAEEVRAAAAFWLGQSGAAALPLLVQTARHDRSEGVREKAVFAISRIDAPAATDTLIDLAKDATNRQVREKAVFWLAQKASDKAAAALAGIAQNDPDVDIRKQAVFALSRLPADQGVPRLIRIAQTSRNIEVRKQAIFWLGQSGDPRAVEVLAKIARGK